MSEETNNRLTPPPRQLPALLLVTTALVFICLAFYFGDPTTPGRFWVCPFHKLTGLDCPGCGAQRAAHMLLHGRPLYALALNAFAVLLVFPLIAYGYLSFALNSLGLARLPMLKPDIRWIMALVVMGIIFGILRNLPFSPFTALSP